MIPMRPFPRLVALRIARYVDWPIYLSLIIIFDPPSVRFNPSTCGYIICTRRICLSRTYQFAYQRQNVKRLKSVTSSPF
jgi:hypothetical protein